MALKTAVSWWLAKATQGEGQLLGSIFIRSHPAPTKFKSAPPSTYKNSRNLGCSRLTPAGI